MCSVLITYLLVTTPLPSGVCGLRPAAPREVQGAFTPKITLRVPLFPLLHSLQRRRGTTCHIGVEWHRWYTRCVAGARDGRVVLVLRGPHTALCCLGVADHASSHLCMCVRTRVSICIEMYLRNCAPMPRFSGISSYGRPTILLHTAGCPTLPSCHWGSPRPLGLAGLGAPPPVLPGSCCPQLRSRRRYWGRTKSLLLWLCLGPLGGGEDEGVARRSSWKARGI